MEFHFQIKNIFPFVSKTLHPYFLEIFHVALIIETHIKWCLMGIYVILRCGGNFHFRLVPTNSKGCSHHALTRFNLWEKREREREKEKDNWVITVFGRFWIFLSPTPQIPFGWNSTWTAQYFFMDEFAPQHK